LTGRAKKAVAESMSSIEASLRGRPLKSLTREPLKSGGTKRGVNNCAIGRKEISILAYLRIEFSKGEACGYLKQWEVAGAQHNSKEAGKHQTKLPGETGEMSEIASEMISVE